MQTMKFNFCGRIFEIGKDTLTKIPTLNDMVIGVTSLGDGDIDIYNPDKPIFVERSPLVFDQVLSFVLDRYHPYPAEFMYELDYYGIEYDINKLYKADYATIEYLAEVMNEVIGIKKTINNDNTIIKGGIINIIETLSHADTQYVCPMQNCSNYVADKISLLCNDCIKRKQCAYYVRKDRFYCQENAEAGDNYCKKHVLNVITRCNYRGCILSRVGDKLYCAFHFEVKKIKH